MNLKIFWSLTLSAVLPFPPPLAAQQQPAAVQSGGLKINVVQGEGARNSIRGRTGVSPAVEVRDEEDKPVAGAEVVFQLPASGPGGVFHGWMRMQTARTNAQGYAAASAFTPNDQEGRFNIKVTATQGNKSASTVIAQINVQNGAQAQPARGSRKWIWALVGLGLAGAIGGGVAASRNGDSEPAAATNPVTITPGPVAVAGPR